MVIGKRAVMIADKYKNYKERANKFAIHQLALYNRKDLICNINDVILKVCDVTYGRCSNDNGNQVLLSGKH